MAFFYDDNAVKTPYRSTIPYEEQAACQHWTTHYGNRRMLDFFSANTRDAREKIQITREIVICDRKMEHWRRHPRWSAEGVAPLKAVVDASWERKTVTPSEG